MVQNFFVGKEMGDRSIPSLVEQYYIFRWALSSSLEETIEVVR
jgi:hypothetical protein